MPLDKNSIIRDAQKYSARGQVDKAIAEWQKLLKDTPNDSNIYNNIGDLHLRVRAQKEAIESYRKAASILQKDGFALKAIAIYKKIININPNQIDALLSLAELNAERGLVGNANENYLSAAEYYTKEGSVAKALEVYERMVNLNPGNVNLRLRLAEMYIKEGFPDNGVKKYLEAANAFLERGEIGKAKELYTKVISQHPKNFDALKGLCTIYQKEDNFKESFDVINKAISLFPDKKDIRLLYGKAAFHIGKLNEAEKVLARLSAEDSANADARELLARVYLKEGKKEASLNEFRVLLEGLIQKDELDSATTILQEMIDIDHDNPQLHHQLLDLYKKLGKNEGMKKEYEFLASIYINQGVSDKATNILKTLIDIDPVNNEYKRRLEAVERGLHKVVPSPAIVEESTQEETVIEESPSIKEEIPPITEESPFIKEEIPSITKEGPSIKEVTEYLEEKIEEFPPMPVFEEKPAEKAPEGEVIKIVPEITAAKSENEVLSEAEVYARYGLVDKAVDIIRQFLDLNRDNITARIALKDILKNQEMKAEFVDECLTLADIYEKQGKVKERSGILNEAYEIDPRDERILNKISPKIYPERIEKEAASVGIEKEAGGLEIGPEQGKEVGFEETTIPESLEERISEADFYAQQGLFEEAIKVYKSILKLQPENENIRKKVEALSGFEEKEEEITLIKEQGPVQFEEPHEEVTGVPIIKEEPERLKEEEAEPFTAKEELREEQKEEEVISLREEPKPIEHEEIIKDKPEKITPRVEEHDTVVLEGEEDEFINFADEVIAEVAAEEAKTAIEAETPKATFEDKNLQEIFQEFKKGVDREIGEDDYDTHYNLGIAYKEMGLIDEALGEFQAAAKDPSRYVQALSMLGICFIEKGLYKPAINEFKKALEAVGEGSEEYMGLKYDLGNAYEEAGMFDEALSTYTDIYNMDAKFREVTSRIDWIKKKMKGKVYTEKKAEETVYPEKKVQKPKKNRVSYI